MNIDSLVVPELNEELIASKIYIIRGQKVMLDFELAKIYGYETKRFNEQVKNNIERFDEDFRFRLTKEEYDLILRSKKSTAQIWTVGNKGGRTSLPYAFTEQGIYMLATVLKGKLAEQQSIFIMRAFREMRLVTAKVSEVSVQVAGTIDWKNKAEERFDIIQRSIDTLNENFVSDKDFKNFVIYKG